MGLFDHFPYTNVHELNLDWILSMMKALEAEWEAFISGNSLTFADPMLHDVTKTYAKNTIVLDGNGNAYVSLQAVPVGVGLQNGDYWLMVFDYEAFIEKVNKNFTARYYRGNYRATAAMDIGDWLTVDDVLCKATAAIAVDDVLEVGVNIEHFTLEDFIKAFMQSANQLIQQYKNDIDASELLYRQQLAGDIASTTASLQAQLNAAISGVTVDSEVINARVGADGVAYPTLGDAIRNQVSDVTTLIENLNGSKIITTSNYSTDLPDLNNATNRSVYILNFSIGQSMPANMPDTFDYEMSLLITMGNTNGYKVQYIIRGSNIYVRTGYAGIWQNWILNDGSFAITANNYTTYLGNLNSAKTGTVYMLNFGANDARPTNCPTGSISNGLLFTGGIVGALRSQYIICRECIYERVHNGVSWGSWNNILDLSVRYIKNHYTIVHTGNYATELPDLNSADADTIYELNFAANSSMPANMPDTSEGYSAAYLITIKSNLYYRQFIIADEKIYMRLYAGIWQSWSIYYDIRGVIDKGPVTSGNYSTVLPDLNNAKKQTVYELNFAANSSMPANMPDTHEFSMAKFTTLGRTSYAVQTISDANYEYIRIAANNVWQDWILVKHPDPIYATPTTLIKLLKKYNGTDATIILKNGTYDVYQMYLDEYGANYWNDYEGYLDTTDPFDRGVQIQDVNVIADGNAQFTFSGATTTYIQQYFSMINVSGRVKLKGIKVNVGSDLMRYAVHDDMESSLGHGCHIEYSDCIFSGTPHETGLIGGGFMSGGRYAFSNCIFTDNTSNTDLSYHSHRYGTKPACIVVSNCKGSKDCIFQWYGDGTLLNKCNVNNSEFREIKKQASGATPNSIDNIDLIKYLNYETI